MSLNELKELYWTNEPYRGYFFRNTEEMLAALEDAIGDIFLENGDHHGSTLEAKVFEHNSAKKIYPEGIIAIKFSDGTPYGFGLDIEMIEALEQGETPDEAIPDTGPI